MEFIQIENNDKCNSHGCSCQYDGKQREYLSAVHRFIIPSESDQVQDRRVDHQFNAHQYQNGVAPGHYGIQARRKQAGAHDQEMCERNHGVVSSFRVRWAAPIKAIISRTETISKGSKYRVMSCTPMGCTV